MDNLTNIAYETATDGTSYSVLAGRSIDSHLAVSQSNGQTLFGLTDGINSTVATVDQTGAKQAQFLYEPYGQTTASGAYPFLFSGRTPATGNLYYNRARFYDAASGRFISEDQIGIAGGDTNLYKYASADPIIFTDPSGRIVLYKDSDKPLLDTVIYIVGLIAGESNVGTAISGFGIVQDLQEKNIGGVILDVHSVGIRPSGRCRPWLVRHRGKQRLGNRPRESSHSQRDLKCPFDVRYYAEYFGLVPR